MAKKTRSRILRRSSRLKLRANGEYLPRVWAGREISSVWINLRKCLQNQPLPFPIGHASGRSRRLYCRRDRPDGRSARDEAGLYLARPADRAERCSRGLVAVAPARGGWRPAPRGLISYISASFTVSMSTYSRMRRILPPSISKTKQYSLR
jgi:hypothetical protein